jgi:hypothetical protein
MQTQIIYGIAAIIWIVFILYCIYTAQLVDDDYNPLKPSKTLKDLWSDIVNWFEGLNDHLALGLLILLFFSLVWLVNRLLFNI